MPRRYVETWTLQTWCNISIAKNIDTVWLREYTNQNNEVDWSNYLYIIGPFEYLTSEQIENIIYKLADTNSLKKHHLQLLIDGRLTSLDLSKCRKAIGGWDILKLLSQRCPNLKELNVVDLPINKSLCRTLTSHPRLVSLDLSGTKIQDVHMDKIGELCKCLQNLKLPQGTTEVGIKNLCVAEDSMHPKCPSLLKLGIGNPYINVEGLQIPLKELKKLQILDHYNMLYGIYSLHQDHIERNGVPPSEKYSVRNLYSSNAEEHDYDLALSVAIEYCPEVTEVQLFNTISNETLVKLAKLEKLQKIHLANISQSFNVFQDGLVPVLQIRGSNITHLHLIDVDNIDVEQVGICCPELQSFILRVEGLEVVNFPEHKPIKKSVIPFTKLMKLSLMFEAAEVDFPKRYLGVLLFYSHKLEILSLSHIQVLTDDILEEILQNNPLMNLCNLSLYRCNNISGSALFSLLCMKNCLSKMSLLECENITRADKDRMTAEVKDKGYRLEVEWT